MSRKLDAAIAEALGWIVVEWVPGQFAAVKNMNLSLTKNPLPHYSTDGNDMLRLDAEMRGRGWALIVSTHIFDDNPRGKVAATYFKPKEFEGGRMVRADTMPKAVSLAAYHALTGKEWVE